jgi:putative protein-disulfide isomerase
MRAQLHYLYDPLCGWCYAAAPLLDAVARRLPELPVRLHGGGLFSGQRITPGLAAHIREHDARIAHLSGQTFSEPYLQGLLNDPATRLDSPPLIAAILTVTQLDPGSAVAMLRAIQQAHYQHGWRVSEPDRLLTLAQSVGLSAPAFGRAFAAQLATGVDHHLAQTAQLMARTGAAGYPTLALQQGDRLLRLDHSRCYGHPEDFADLLHAQLQTESAS